MNFIRITVNTIEEAEDFLEKCALLSFTWNGEYNISPKNEGNQLLNILDTKLVMLATTSRTLFIGNESLSKLVAYDTMNYKEIMEYLLSRYCK